MNLLKQPKVVVRTFSDITESQMVKLLKARKQKKYGFLDVAYDVVEIDNGKFNVRMEYIAK